MNVYTCTDHENFYVGAASVVVAENEDEARRLLIKELAEHGLKQETPFTLHLLNVSAPRAFVLHNGDY